MIARIWRTGVEASRQPEYETFAQQYSLPMFRQQKGLLGVQILNRPGQSLVVTLWEHEADIEAMEQHPVYRETVQKILVAGFLTSPQSVEIFTIGDGFLTDAIREKWGKYTARSSPV